MSHLLSQETDEVLLLKPHVYVAQEGEVIFFPRQTLELANACFLALFLVYRTVQNGVGMIYLRREFLL